MTRETVKFDYTGWDKYALKRLADDIYAKLKLTKQVDLEEELLDHYHRCKDSAILAHKGLEEGNTTAGAAAVLTAATGALKELARLQTDTYNAARVQILERCMTDALKTADNSEEVLEEFRRMLAEAEVAV